MGGSWSLSLQHISNITRFTLEEVTNFYVLFKNNFPSEKLNQGQFIDFYEHITNDSFSKELAENVFNRFDENGDGYVDFKEIMVAFSCTTHGTEEEKLSWEFRMSDHDNDGFISKEEVRLMLESVFQNNCHMNLKKEAHNTMKKIFVGADDNKDGKFSLEELKAHIADCTEVFELISNLRL